VNPFSVFFRRWKICALLVLALTALVLTADAHHAPSHAIGIPRLVNNFSILVLRVEQFTFTNPREGCEQRNDCDLESIKFFIEDYEIPSDGDLTSTIRGTGFLAGIKTKTVDTLRKYSIVQFLRGCSWVSQESSDGSVNNYFGVVRNGGHLGERTLFVHREWMVDTNDNVTAYHATGGESDTHFFLQWSNPEPTWIPDRQANLLGEIPATVPFGFITDHPGPAVYRPARQIIRDDGKLIDILAEAQNMSLQFKTCVYKTADVPTTTDGSMRGLGKPIVCHTWQQSFVYNHQLNKFESPPAPHAECSRPFTKDEQRAQDMIQQR
jgi:hypothetical protein